MSKVTFEEALAKSLPAGYKSTLLEADRLRRLNNANLSVLGDTVDEYDGNTITENDIIANTAERFLTQFLTPERTLEFPGLALSLDDSNNLLEKFAARYKADNDTPSGTVKDPVRAGTDDIVFTFLTPEVLQDLAANDPNTKRDYFQTGLTGGNRLDLIGDEGIDATANAADTSLSLAPDEYVFLTGDFIDLSGGQSVITATEYADVDGEDFGPVNAVFSNRLSGAHILTTQGTYATASLDLDAKIYASGDAEIVPVGFAMLPGTKAPSLV